MHTFQMHKGFAGRTVEYRWRLMNANGQVVARGPIGEGYTNEGDCLAAIHLFQEDVRIAPVEEATTFGSDAEFNIAKIKEWLTIVVTALPKAREFFSSQDDEKLENFCKKLLDSKLIDWLT